MSATGFEKLTVLTVAALSSAGFFDRLALKDMLTPPYEGLEKRAGNSSWSVQQYTLGIQSPNLRMVMEPNYYAEEMIGHPNHQLRIWLDA